MTIDEAIKHAEHVENKGIRFEYQDMPTKNRRVMNIMRTLDEILKIGIKEEDWTYCKAEYAPHNGCKIGMPEAFTPDGTTRDKVEICYIVTIKFRNGEISTRTDCMYLSDGRFYWYDNLWDADDVVEQEITDEWFMEPIAWIPYKNDPVHDVVYPVAPCNEDAVPTPPTPKA